MQPATEIPVEDLPLMIAGLGLSFEAVCGGALHNMDPRLIERIYRATWWVPSALMITSGVLGLWLLGPGLGRALAATAGVIGGLALLRGPSQTTDRSRPLLIR